MMMRPLGYSVSLIAVSPDEAVPRGVPLGNVRMPSLDTPTTRTWLEDHRRDSVFAVPGDNADPHGHPALLIAVTPDEYNRLVSSTPR